MDDSRSDTWGEKAKKHFDKLGNPVGGAHVAMAQGLGHARVGHYDKALARFVSAARIAEAVDSERGRQLAGHARENAGRALQALGHTADDGDAGGLDGTDLRAVLEQQRRFSEAEGQYDTGKSAFDRGEYQAAYSSFDAAVKGFDALGEQGYLATARRARGWAARNLALRKPAGTAVTLYRKAVADGEATSDVELIARASTGEALARAELGHTDAIAALHAAADVAEQAGLGAESARCLVEVALRSSDLAERAAAARRGLDLAGPQDSHAVYGMYSVAVDAYNQDEYALAVELSDEILPHAGKLHDAVSSVRQAAVDARGAQ